jgi:predicted NodU family carbamoyl transferase
MQSPLRQKSSLLDYFANEVGMNFLGISGLERAVPFKRERWPGLEAREYRIAQGHDSAAALVVDGELVAAAEQERFSRKKHTGTSQLTRSSFAFAQLVWA